MAAGAPPAWTPALERALLHHLLDSTRTANRRWFGGRLRPPVLRLSDTRSLGRWIPAERVLELSRPLVLERPWAEVLEVLRHELAHQYVDEVLGVRDEPPHGPTFQRVCRERAIDARAAGLPSAPPEEPRSARLVERVRRLFALAASDNQHEAELAMQRAQELMLRHQLSLETGEQHYVFRHVGRPKRRKSRAEGLIAALLADHFFVEVIWVYVYAPYTGHIERVLEVCGTEGNVSMADYVHDFLLRTAEELWTQARASHPNLGPGDRSAYLAGVIAGFRQKLEQARRNHQSTGLIYLGDPALQTYYRRRHPQVRTRSARPSPRWAVQALGRAHGENVVLHRPLEQDPSAAGPRLLGD